MSLLSRDPNIIKNPSANAKSVVWTLEWDIPSEKVGLFGEDF